MHTYKSQGVLIYMRCVLKPLFYVCLFLMLLSVFACAEEAAPMPYPEALRIQVTHEEWQTDDNRTCKVALFDTPSDAIDAELLSLQKELLQDLLAHTGAEHQLMLEGTYRISGARWCGFLLMGRALLETTDTTISYPVATTDYLCYRTVTYDMETGEKLTLQDVFPEDSPAWSEIQKAVRNRLLAVYPHLLKDMTQVESYTEALASLSFLPSAGRLTLCMPLWPLHENSWQLLNTYLPYPDYRQWMTEEAQTQTDNSARSIIAITYDDGPIRVQTERVIAALADNGASASFFCLGRNVEMWPDIVRREMDYGHTVGSHTYKHKYDFQVSAEYLREDRLQCKRIHRELTGFAAELFRAPGGNTDKYQKYNIGWPIILWRFSAGDTGNNNAYKLADRITFNAKNGDIILMHDIYEKTAKGSEMFLSRLAENGYLFATVDELLYLHGITPQPDTIYYDAFTPPVAAQ